MPLITPESNNFDEFDVKAADRLRSILVVKKKVTTKYSQRTSARQFALLKKVLNDEQAEARITNVLDWFAKHANDPYCPLINSAISFRTKFLQLEHQAPPLCVEFSITTINLADELRNTLYWPYGFENNLEIVIENSMDNLKVFHRKLDALINQERSDKLHGFARHVSNKWGSDINSRINLVRNWMTSVNKKLNGMGAPPIGVNGFTLSEDHFLLGKMLEEESGRWSGSALLGGMLLVEINL